MQFGCGDEHGVMPSWFTWRCSERMRRLSLHSWTRCRAKRNVSSPDYATSRWVERPPRTTTACVQPPTCTTSLVCYRHLANVTGTQLRDQSSVVWEKPTKLGCRDNVPSGIEKNNFTLSSYRHNSINPETFAKIGPIYVEIIVWQKSLKNKHCGCRRAKYCWVCIE